jgi:hypothetical protein
MLPTARKLAFTDVPVVDLAPLWSGGAAGRRAVADEIAEACGRVGFFYVNEAMGKLVPGGLIVADDISWNASLWDFADAPGVPSYNFRGTMGAAFF